jgi:uncharacterized membrane protein
VYIVNKENTTLDPKIKKLLISSVVFLLLAWLVILLVVMIVQTASLTAERFYVVLTMILLLVGSSLAVACIPFIDVNTSAGVLYGTVVISGAFGFLSFILLIGLLIKRIVSTYKLNPKKSYGTFNMTSNEYDHKMNTSKERLSTKYKPPIGKNRGTSFSCTSS